MPADHPLRGEVKPAPKLETAGRYRLLNRHDAISAGDERLMDDCEAWEALEANCAHFGRRYDGNVFVPMRRKSDRYRHAGSTIGAKA